MEEGLLELYTTLCAIHFEGLGDGECSCFDDVECENCQVRRAVQKVYDAIRIVDALIFEEAEREVSSH